MASQEDRPQFLKLILEETIHEGKLLIPEGFGKEHLNGVSVPTKVTLQIPSGIKWVVELSESNGTLWLLNGWKEFAEDLSLEHGQSVMFRYNGGCNFRVFVFAKSCEIKYPSSCRKRERSFPSQTRPCKNRRTDHSSHHENEPETNSNQEPNTADVMRGGESSNGFKHGKNYHPELSFKSEKPHFKVEISSDNAKELTIPTWFASDHLSRTGDVKLRVADGKSWTVALSYSQQKPFTAKFIGLKWRAFVRHNNLQEGDVCVFEMIKSNVFKVRFLSTTGGRSSPQGPSSPETPKALENTHKSVKENPSFTKTLNSTVAQYMYLPTKFGLEHLSGTDQVKLRVSDGRTWTVQFVFFHPASNKNPVPKFFGQSWRNFVMSNNLQQGGVCVFELIKGKESMFNVSFSTSDVNRCWRTTSGGKSNPPKPPTPETQVCGNPPSFTKAVQSSWASNQMRVPVEFTGNHIPRPGEDRDLILEVEGRSWELRLAFTGRYGTFTTGWPQFAKDNHLRPTDVCVFKLIEGSDDILRMKVTIKKS